MCKTRSSGLLWSHTVSNAFPLSSDDVIMEALTVCLDSLFVDVQNITTSLFHFHWKGRKLHILISYLLLEFLYKGGDRFLLNVLSSAPLCSHLLTVFSAAPPCYVLLHHVLFCSTIFFSAPPCSVLLT